MVLIMRMLVIVGYGGGHEDVGHGVCHEEVGHGSSREGVGHGGGHEVMVVVMRMLVLA